MCKAQYITYELRAKRRARPYKAQREAQSSASSQILVIRSKKKDPQESLQGGSLAVSGIFREKNDMSEEKNNQVIRLPEAFCSRMKEMLGEDYPAFLSAFSEGRSWKALRVNTLKTDLARFRAVYRGDLDQVPWAENGFYYDEADRPGRSPLHEAGLYYIQEPSAMAVAALSGTQPGERVLDLCAAPGGKSTQLAAMLEGQGLLVANEIHPARARILSQNIERMGIKNALVTNEAPEDLALRFPAFFDRIIVDAPCSGEGMFRKEEQALACWSQDNVDLCARRQASILDSAAAMLTDGGVLIYSTCTFAPEEDEGSIAAFLVRHPDFSILPLASSLGERLTEYGFDRGNPAFLDLVPSADPAMKARKGLEETIRLWPHRLRGEGHFVAALVRQGKKFRARTAGKSKGPDQASLKLWKDFEKEALKTDLQGTFLLFGSELYLEPEPVPLKGLKVLRPGLHLGTLKKNRFEPAHALALSLQPEEAKSSLDLPAGCPEAAAYLRGEALPCSGQRGWTLISLDGCSLGWGKAGGSMIKNHYPRGLRIAGI